jgi:hypothetical protein
VLGRVRLGLGTIVQIALDASQPGGRVVHRMRTRVLQVLDALDQGRAKQAADQRPVSRDDR